MADSPNGRTDAELLRENAETAFTELYHRHAATVHAWFRRRLEWAASDLTAETFAQAWLSRRRFGDERAGSALPWLLGIARNVLRDSARRDRIETKARGKLGLPLDLSGSRSGRLPLVSASPARCAGWPPRPRRRSYERTADQPRPLRAPARARNEELAATEANLALLSMRRQHPDAAVKPGITVEGFASPKK